MPLQTLVSTFAVLLGLAGPLCAQKEFFVESRTLPAGTSQQDILIEADSDIPLFGFSFGVAFDPAILNVTEVTWRGALPAEPAFFHGTVDNVTGELGYGCVLDYGPDFDNTIPAGENIALARLVVDVVSGTEAVTELRFADTFIGPGTRVKNVMTTGEGQSAFPELRDGTVTVLPPDPGAEVLFLRGDSNSDDRIDLSDAVRVLDFLFGGQPPGCFDAMDANDDGRVDLSDPIFVLSFLFGGGRRIPLPYPQRGPDPTEDGLPACGDS